MRRTEVIQQKIFELEELKRAIVRWRFAGKTISFTNGCFDILHEGHITSLSQAAQEADLLVVGVNSDASTKRLKGETRPLNNQKSRALLLASLLMVDAVIIFNDDTPLSLIEAIEPDVLIKGGDYTIETIVGAKEVIANGGRVVINEILPGISTTGMIKKISAL